MGKLEDRIKKLFDMDNGQRLSKTLTEDANKRRENANKRKEEEKIIAQVEETVKTAYETMGGAAAATLGNTAGNPAKGGIAGAAMGRIDKNKIGKATINADTQAKKMADKVEEQEREVKDKNKDESEQTI